MYVRQLKRKCSVRGCKNTDTFAIARTREIGNTVIICKECLGKALKAVDEVDPVTKTNAPVKETVIPPLFFNGEKGVKSTTQLPVDNGSSVLKTSENEGKDAEEEGDFMCPECGKVCKTEAGLQKHINYHKQETKKKG